MPKQTPALLAPFSIMEEFHKNSIWTVAEICAKIGTTTKSYYRWKKEGHMPKMAVAALKGLAEGMNDPVTFRVTCRNAYAAKQLQEFTQDNTFFQLEELP